MEAADGTPIPDAATIVGLLAGDERRRVVAALVLGATTVDEVRTATGLGARAVGEALARLVNSELVIRDDDGSHALLAEAFRRAAMAAAPDRPEPDPTGTVPEDAARVLRTFLRGGRLVSIPTHRAKRLVILDRLAEEFDVGRRYSERQVNAILRRFHEDFAALRRYLVDEGFLDRESGQYWRSGGTVQPRADRASRGAGAAADQALVAGLEAGLGQGVAGPRRPAVGGIAADRAQLELAKAALVDQLGQRAGPPCVGLSAVEQKEAVTTALEVGEQCTTGQHHERARRTSRPPLDLRPRQRRAVGLGRVGGGEHDRRAVAAQRSRSARRRSTAPGRANCAAPSPATK